MPKAIDQQTRVHIVEAVLDGESRAEVANASVSHCRPSIGSFDDKPTVKALQSAQGAREDQLC